MELKNIFTSVTHKQEVKLQDIQCFPSTTKCKEKYNVTMWPLLLWTRNNVFRLHRSCAHCCQECYYEDLMLPTTANLTWVSRKDHKVFV